MIAQKLEEGTLTKDQFDADTPFYVRHRKMVGFLIPLVIIWTCYFSYMAATNKWHIFSGTTGANNSPRWLITVTMCFGAMVAGATSEGGAAIAFPVLTLTLGVPPPQARDFSFLIQSVGMTAALFSIWFMKVKCEWKSILYCTIGGFAGCIFGLEEVAPRLEPAYSKMYFVCIWFSFAISLYWMNYFRGDKVHDNITNWDDAVIATVDLDKLSPGLKATVNWKAIVLLMGGFLGGIFSAMSGSGLDICSFALLTLLFRVDERVATPTSVVLMAINTLIAFFYRLWGQGNINPEVYNMWLVAVPVVCVFAPIGSIISSHFHRALLAGLIYVVDIVQFIGALVIVKPWLSKAEGGKTTTPEKLCWSSGLILTFGIIFFTIIAFSGKYLETYQNDLAQKEWDAKTKSTKGAGSEVQSSSSSSAGGSNYYVTGTSEDQLEMTNKV